MKTIKEMIKEVQLLELELRSLSEKENRESTVMFLQGEDIHSTYDFEEFDKEYDRIQKEIFDLKTIINGLNQTVITEYKGLTIGQALIALGQKNAKMYRLSRLANVRRVDRDLTRSGEILMTKHLYDEDHVRQMLHEEMKEIHQLQTAIDKANILNGI